MAKTRSSKTKIHDIRQKRRITSYRARALFWTKILTASFVLIFIFTPIMQGVKKDIGSYFYDASNRWGFSVKKIAVTGQKNSNIEEIIKISGIEKNKSIFLPNLNQARQNLQQHKWVREVAVSRILPHKITLHLQEHRPLAIWQNDGQFYVINDQGDSIIKFANHRKIDKKFLKLIHVVGRGANVHAANLENTLSDYKKIRQKILSASRIENRRWNLHFRSGLVVKMPEKEFKSAMKYLAKLDAAGTLDKKNKFIDLRNSAKFYIKKN